MYKKIFFTLFLLVQCAFSDVIIPPKPYKSYSLNKKSYLYIEPKSFSDLGGCKGSLFVKQDKKFIKKWERPLINNIAPAYATPTDTGKFTVTIDEFGKSGRVLPIIIYNKFGEVTSVHNFQSLDINEDLDKMKVSIHQTDWFSGSVLAFHENENYLYLKLRWGKVIIIDLIHGIVFNKKELKIFPYKKDLYLKLIKYFEKKIK